MVKKVISVLISVVVVLSVMSVSGSAASYSSGTYEVESSIGVNVRKGAGTGYTTSDTTNLKVNGTLGKKERPGRLMILLRQIREPML